MIKKHSLLKTFFINLYAFRTGYYSHEDHTFNEKQEFDLFLIMNKNLTFDHIFDDYQEFGQLYYHAKHP